MRARSTTLLVSRETVVTKARECVGARFKRKGRSRIEGFDCLGILLYVSNGVGYTQGLEIKDYPDIPPTGLIQREMGSRMELKQVRDLQAGDAVIMAYDGRPIHIGIIASRAGRLSVIHASARSRRVIEHDISDEDRIVRAYEFRGID